MLDATKELSQMRERKQDLRRVAYRHSKLRVYRAELVELRRAGASYRELAEWLRRTQRRRVAPSTIQRYLVQLPELQEQANA
jgi:hypothetical protein